MARMLGERGISTKMFATKLADDASRIAAESITNGAEIIISYGGDGTLNEVIQSMPGTNAKLAIWPGGTANVAAVELGMPSDIKRLADVIAAGKTKRIALGIARQKAENGRMGEWETSTGGSDFSYFPTLPLSRSENRIFNQKSNGRYFFMFAGIGLDASIARNVNLKFKRVAGELAFWAEGLRHLVTWRPEIFAIEVEGKRYESAFTLIGNGSRYGGGISVTPGAKLEEPWFEVYILPPQSNKMVYLQNLVACLIGKPERTPAIVLRARRVEANSSHEPWVEVDGEVIGPLPMSFEIVPDALSVIVP